MKAHILESFIQRVWNEGDVESASDFIAPAYTIHHDPGDPWEGMTLDAEGFKDRVRESRAPVPDQRFSLRDVCEDRDRVVITWVWTGTHQGEIAGFAGTGRELAMSGATVYHFEGERIAKLGKDAILVPAVERVAAEHDR